MIAKKENIYRLTLDEKSVKNLARVLLKYVDCYEQDTYEIDEFTTNELEELVDVIGDEELTSKIRETLDEIFERCEER